MGAHRPAGVVVVVVVVLVGVALAVLWLGNVTAYEPDGRTRCGPALQEWQNLFADVAGRCHLARQDRLWLGLRMAAAMAAAGAVMAAAGWRLARQSPVMPPATRQQGE